MDEEIFFIWSVKTNAWWGQVGTYVSDVSKAREFTEAKAIAFCKSRFTVGEELTAVPVPKRLVEEIKKP